MLNNDSGLCTPIVITFISLGGVAFIGLLQFGSRRVFNWHRTRIVLNRPPSIEVELIKQMVGYIKAHPLVRINLRNADIFSRQPSGHYWLTGQLVLPTGQVIVLQTQRFPYEYSMDLNTTHTFEYTPTDWSLWANRARLLTNSVLKANIHINDRSLRLVEQRIDNFRFTIATQWR